MQFDDEKDLNNDDFLLEENSGSISWEDLLNSNEDIDLEKLVKKDAVDDIKGDLKTDNISDLVGNDTDSPLSTVEAKIEFDPNAKTEEVPAYNNVGRIFPSLPETEKKQEEIIEEKPPVEEPQLKTLDALVDMTAEASIKEEPSLLDEPELSSVDKVLSAQKEEEPKQEAPKEFDLKAAANNYMNSLSTDDMGVKSDSISLMNSINDTKVDDSIETFAVGAPEKKETSNDTNLESFLADVPPADNNEVTPESILDDLPVASNDAQGEFSLDDIPVADNDNFEGKDLSGYVDDELMNLLDSSDNSSNDPLDSLPAYNETDYSENSYTQAGADIINRLPQRDVDDDINNQAYEDDVEEDIAPPKKKKGFSPLIAAAMLGLTALLAFAAYIFFPKLQEGATDLLAGSNEPVTAALPQTEPAQQAPNEISQEQAKKEVKEQRKELVDKLDIENETKDKENNTAKKSEKVVVSVATSGRTNPFLPSLMFGKDGFAQVGTDLSSPPDETMIAPDAPQVRKMLTMTVSGIMFDKYKPSAIVKMDGKDYFVQAGDRIDGYQISQITKEYVSLKSGANTYKAYVGETFNAEAPIDDMNSVKMINGNRQYISASDVEINRSQN